MAKASVRGRLWGGLSASGLGMAGTLLGLYWDPLNGRRFGFGDIGLMQVGMMAGGVILCIVGIVILSMPWGRAGSPPSERGDERGSNGEGASRGMGAEGEEE